MSNRYNALDYINPEEVLEMRTRERDLSADMWLKALAAMPGEDREKCVEHFGNDLTLHIGLMTQLLERGDEVVKLAATKELDKAILRLVVAMTDSMGSDMKSLIETFVKASGK